MKIYKYPSKEDWPLILKRKTIDDLSLDELVKNVLDDVKRNGDEAVKRYTLQFDKVDITKTKVSKAEISEAILLVDDELKAAIHLAKANIEKFHKAQIPHPVKVETMPGVVCWQKSVAIEKVGLYVPGGNAPLFSTVLMLGIPALIAGCKEIVFCTPPNKVTGKINPVILYTANLLGIKDIFKIGGVQAIAAMAYGTKTVPKVYKIFGPGNQYVTAAKQLVSRQTVAIDMPAGPSEQAFIADSTSNPVFVASDLLSQLEHGIDSQSILITTDAGIVAPVIEEINSQMEALPKKDIAKESLKNSCIIVVKTDDEAIELMNEYAPEHLIIATKNADELAERIVNAGSIFIGPWATESAGDYASGTNHTLPTNGYAKQYSGVNLDSYMKKITYQKISEEGILAIGPAIEKMAEAEELFAHKNSATVRLNELRKK